MGKRHPFPVLKKEVDSSRHPSRDVFSSTSHNHITGIKRYNLSPSPHIHSQNSQEKIKKDRIFVNGVHLHLTNVAREQFLMNAAFHYTIDIYIYTHTTN